MDDLSSNNYLVAGLGNPGREYRYTKHNIGFMVIDKLAVDFGVKLTKVQNKTLITVHPHNAGRVVIAKPQTYMNLSGQAVASLMHFYKVPLTNLLVAYDDIDLPVGTIRIRPGGGSAGQRGLASIIEKLGTQDFARLRVGVGRPPGHMDAAAYVLQEFNKADQPIMERVIADASEAIRLFLDQGLEKSMNAYNGSLDPAGE